MLWLLANLWGRRHCSYLLWWYVAYQIDIYESLKGKVCCLRISQVASVEFLSKKHVEITHCMWSNFSFVVYMGDILEELNFSQCSEIGREKLQATGHFHRCILTVISYLVTVSLELLGIYIFWNEFRISEALGSLRKRHFATLQNNWEWTL